LSTYFFILRFNTLEKNYNTENVLKTLEPINLPMLFQQVLRKEVSHLNLDMPNIPQTIYEIIISKRWNGNIQ
tara:strand:- start:830 stop:1045 length:216 start_codon:yes stop_codon:yes gene_type:complete